MAIISKRFALVFHLVLAVSMVLASVDSDKAGFLEPPERPAVFTSVEQMKSYIKALNDYYLLLGRPRLDHF